MANSNKQSTRQVSKKGKKKDKKDLLTYQKRAGTSGIRGQLYETKLLSLIYFKALHDEDIQEFFLATNVDEIGMFDDICLRAKLKGFEKPIQVFIQAKHRENEKLLTLTSKKDLANCFDSYLKVRRRFQSGIEDLLFKGTIEETDCVFVMYTTAKDDGNNKVCEDDCVIYLNKLIGTGNGGCKRLYTDEDVELLSQQILEEQLLTLAQTIVKYMFDEAKSQMMNDELVLRYHYVLAQKVFDVSEILAEGHRIAGFRQDFFHQSEKFIQIFKDALCSKILNRRKIDIENEKQGLLAQFLSDPDSCDILSELLRGNVITLKHGNLEFRDKMIPQPYKLQLDRINHYKKGIKEIAIEVAVRECMTPLEFKVPATFGNIDIAISSDEAKIIKRLDHLIKKIIDLIDKTKPNDVIAIDDSLDDGLLRLNGGIASAIGSIFVLDNTSKLYKFCENSEPLRIIAKQFFAKLQSKIPNMHDLRFDLRSKLFPKLSLHRNQYDEDLVKDFFNKLVFYTSQGDENNVEKRIKEDIKTSLGKSDDAEKKSDAIFLKYHDEVQKWWMLPKSGTYLTKHSELYKNAVESTKGPKIEFSHRVISVENGRIVASYEYNPDKSDSD